MSNGLETIRQRYPWPNARPDVPESLAFDNQPDGWCAAENITMFKRLCNEQTQVVIELGSWLGRSTLHLLAAAPNATVICVDHWQGSTEHHLRPEWKAKLPTLYETFLRHVWEHRHRAIPLRAITLIGLEMVAAASIGVDVIYVDASHDARSVDADIRTTLLLFPQAKVCGDDWTHGSVREGVQTAVATVPERTLQTNRTCWWLE